MYWLQAYANFILHKSSLGYNEEGYNKKECRFHGLSAYHSSNYLIIRLPTTHSLNNFRVQSHATPSLNDLKRLLVNNISYR